MTANASVWRSKCPYNFEGDVDDCTPCPHCDADNPVPTPSVGHVCEASLTDGPPRRFNGSTPPTVAAHSRALAELHDAAEALANRLAGAGRKWPIGTPDEHVWKLTSDGCRDDQGPSYEWHLRLAAARTHRGLTLDALGAKLNPPRTRKDISAMEHGRRGLSVELCAQLADALDCDRLWLAGWTL